MWLKYTCIYEDRYEEQSANEGFIQDLIFYRTVFGNTNDTG